MASVNAKCQAKNPALCTDPQCPELRSADHRLNQARTYNEYERAAQQKQAILDRQRNARSGQPAAHHYPVRNSTPAPQSNQRPTRPVRQETTREGDPVVKFHKDLGFPNSYEPPTGVRPVVYSQHAKDETNDQYGAIPQLSRVNLDSMELIELKVNAKTKQVYRFLYRGELDDENDICLVLQPIPNSGGKMRVVTNWINQKNDAHRTLRTEEYVIPKRTPVAV